MATEAAGLRRRYICTATTRENENCVAKRGLDRDRERYGWSGELQSLVLSTDTCV
jgi:hypothetical protein